MKYRKKNSPQRKNTFPAKVLISIISVFCLCVLLPVITKAKSGDVGERLDGDWAYISEAGLVEDHDTKSGYAIRTGTAPWDEKQEEGTPGNDVSDKDNVVRSFDIVSYTTYFRSKVRENASYSAYKTGTLHFEFVLPGTKEQVQFETGSMGWLSAKKEADYYIYESEYNGKSCQVLKGSFLWEPNEENPAAIGESYQELTLVLRVLNMKNGDEVAPLFTFWLDGNIVPEDELVTGSDMACLEHGEQEYKTIEAPEVEVTSIPRYNVQLKTCDSRAQYVDTFDFTTGNENALNKDAGSVYGRMDVVGVTIQIVGKSPEHGLKGCEIPDGSDIEFDIDLSAQYRGTDGTSYEVTDSYTPLVWSLDGNEKSNVQNDGREITGVYKFATGGAPMNKGTSYESCSDGGTWCGTQENNTVHIIVSGYRINVEQIPYTDGNVSAGVYTYYNPQNIKNYWDIQTVCFSAGEMWIVQPFYDENDDYIVDLYDTGSFTTTLTDKNLQATGVSGQELDIVEDNTNQMIQTDDHPVLTMALEKPGEIDQSINYQKYKIVEYGSGLTEGCWDNGKDWIVSGGQLNIQEMLKQNSAEGMYTGVAYDDLIKYDDTFFQLENVTKGSSAGLDNMKWKFLYGAKPDKSGWNHYGLEPGEEGYDEEMMEATADNLIFFSSLGELENKGYVCVAVLWEARGLSSPQSTNCYIGLEGHVKETVQAGKVYMVTHCARAWNKMNIQSAAAEYFNKEAAELTQNDYINYTQSDEFPSRENQLQPLNYDADYLNAFWVNDYDTREGFQTYEKSWYDENGYAGGSAGLSYGDSCLVISYTTKIAKDTAQQSGNNKGSKRAYDMDANQRIADYVLKISALRTAGEFTTENAKIVTDIYVEDTLPKGLSYVPDSAFWGGAYVQSGEGKQGTIKNGTKLDPEVQKNKDGTTVLIWKLKNVEIQETEETYFDSIYYSCEIGTPGEEETDVKNNDQLLNSVIIWGSDEQKRDFTASNGNKAEMSIQVSKNNAISLSKMADAPLVDVGDSIGATLSIGNNSDNIMDILAIDSLPYDGDAVGSSFTGECQITEFTVKDTSLLQTIKIYYTSDASQKGKTSVDYNNTDFPKDTIWKELELDSATGKAELPKDFAPVAIAAAGTLPGQKTLKMHINMYLPDGKPGDCVINRLTKDDLESDAKTVIVSRTLEGIVWKDENKNGLYENENKVDGVSAVLMKLNEGGNPEDPDDYSIYKVGEKDAFVETGKQMNALTGEVTDYENGRYKFTNLPSGTFGVLFKDGSFSLYQYEASPVDQGEDDTIDSDAAPTYDETADNRSLETAFISEIIMPETEKMTSSTYNSKYHDLGIYETEFVPDTGVYNNNPGMKIIIIFSGGSIAFITWKEFRRRKRKTV